MKTLYAKEHIDLQNQFNSRKLADLMDQGISREALTEDDQAFIASRDMFFLSSVDPEGMPTVSYKGGPVGVVSVINDQTLGFPGYDGNGMFYSAGNIVGQGKVGLLFIDFETPHRLRVQGTATYHRNYPLIENYPEAQYFITVQISRIWQNCPRYIHRYQKIEPSKYVPGQCEITPLASWKRIDLVQEAISEGERQDAKEQGIITIEEWTKMVKSGIA
jgi:uncharacterized protein